MELLDFRICTASTLDIAQLFSKVVIPVYTSAALSEFLFPPHHPLHWVSLSFLIFASLSEMVSLYTLNLHDVICQLYLSKVGDGGGGGLRKKKDSSMWFPHFPADW